MGGLQITAAPINGSPLVNTGYHCFVDGSWDQLGEGGVGLVLLHDGRLVQWASRSVRPLSASQAEAMAVLEGVKILAQFSDTGGTVYSDSLDSVHSLSGGLPRITDWRSYTQTWEAWRLQRDSREDIQVKHCSREHEFLLIAHNLANQGRICKRDRQGTQIELMEVL
ncbi:RNase H [Carex littledalei]|uniref:RNase H n=1 Tax=Carex littledalei TaxID=544730 RepID=A0A833RAH3_9POAL|nr:RNase H [Carex littledalei]